MTSEEKSDIMIKNLSTGSVYSMLKRFEVENYRCFSEKLVFDLTARDYSFNQNLVRNGIVNKAIIYGIFVSLTLGCSGKITNRTVFFVAK